MQSLEEFKEKLAKCGNKYSSDYIDLSNYISTEQEKKGSFNFSVNPAEEFYVPVVNIKAATTTLVKTNKNYTVGQLKGQLQNTCAITEMQLIVNGRILADDELIANTKIGEYAVKIL